MIKIIYYPEEYRLTVDGHAHSGVKGEDLICAAATGYVRALEFNIANMIHHEQVKDPIMDISEGHADIGCTPFEEYVPIVDIIFSTICIGFVWLMSTYPEHVSFETVPDIVQGYVS